MISFIIFLVIFGILIIVHEFGHFLLAKMQGVRVERFSVGFGPRLLKKKKNHTEYSLSLIPLGGFVKLAGDSLDEYKGKPDEYFSKTPGQRALIIAFGPILNYALGFLCFWLIFFAGYPTLSTKVGSVLDGYGAKIAGINAGDKIIAVDGQNVRDWEDLQKAIQLRKEESRVLLDLLRDGKPLKIEVKIQEKQLDDILGQKRTVGLVGIAPADEIIKVRNGFFKSFSLSLNKTWDLTRITYKAIWRMVTGALSIRESVTGPLGIFYITSKAASLGITAVLHLIALLSVSLAIFNLLPLPVLDGGHLFLLLVEKIRGRGLGPKADQVITRIGLTLIVTLALFVTYNDIARFFGDKILKFFK